MNSFRNANRLQPDDLEVAACLAAIAAFMKDDDVQPQKPGGTVSRWRAAALVEGVRGARIATAKPGGWNPWKAILSISLLLSTLFCGSQSWAAAADNDNQFQDGQTIASNPGAKLKGFADGDSQIVAKTKHTVVKISIGEGCEMANIDAPDGAVVIAPGTGRRIATLPAQSRWSINATTPGTIVFRSRNGRDLAKLAVADDNGAARPAAFVAGSAPQMRSTFNLRPEFFAAMAEKTGYLIVPSGASENGWPGDQLVGFNGKLYRGVLWIRPNGDAPSLAFTTINMLDVEDYLLSVLPSEMPCTWPAEALQAQAIAARSYAYANMGKHAKDGFDLKSTTDDQVYLGVSSERQSSNDAVAVTNGLVLKYDGKPVSAFFHSTSGGSTDLAENVWSKPVPYLKAVADYDDNSPHFSWVRKIHPDDIEKAFGKDIGQMLAMFVVSRSPASNRARSVLVVGTTGTRLLSGDSLRLTLKLPSSNFNLGCEENSYTFAGRGFGHGLGMSQYGAKALAEQGYNAAQILAYYYKDVAVDYYAAAPGI